jgi:hypothetical protein
VGRVHQRQKVAGAIAPDGVVHAMDLGDEPEGFAAGEAVEERQVFRHDADPALDRDRVSEQVGAKDADRARGRPQQPGQALDRRRLSGAVRAEKAEETAGRDGEVDAVDGAQRPEVTAEAARFHRQFHRVIVAVLWRLPFALLCRLLSPYDRWR